MEEQKKQRHVLGQRDETGHYPVEVDGGPVGTVYRRHGSWYAVMPGRRVESRFADRDRAAEHLVMLIDKGIRPTIPAPASRFPARSMRGAAEELRAARTYAFLLPDLRPTLPNLVRAAEATAQLARLGWTPLAGYPGADQPWLLECQLCGWQGRRFWSHLRGRNGDGIPRPLSRHPGCKPVADHKAALIDLAAKRTRECRCEFLHPTTTEQAADVLKSLQNALKEKELTRAVLFARGILEPCSASSRRARALREALTRISD